MCLQNRLPESLFNVHIMDLCLLSCFGIFFKRRLESAAKVFLSDFWQSLKLQNLWMHSKYLMECFCPNVAYKRSKNDTSQV